MELGEVKEELELSLYPEALTRALMDFYPSSVKKAIAGDEEVLPRLAKLVKFGMACRAMPPRITAADSLELVFLVHQYARTTRNGHVRHSWGRIAEEWNRLHPEKPLKERNLRRWYQRYKPGALPVMHSLIEATHRLERAEGPIRARFHAALAECRESLKREPNIPQLAEDLAREQRRLYESLREALDKAAAPLGEGERHYFTRLFSKGLEALKC